MSTFPHRASAPPVPDRRDGRPFFQRTVTEEQQKREDIFLAAATLFANKGYAGTSVREIVEAAGVTKPTLYYYFKNKEDLYIKLMDEAMATFAAVLQQAVGGEGDTRERLKALFLDIFALFRENVDLLRLINAMIYGPQGATPFYDLQGKIQLLHSVLSQILKEGISEGKLREERAGSALLLLLGIVRSVQFHLMVKDPPFLLTGDQICGAIDLIFDGARQGLASPPGREG